MPEHCVCIDVSSFSLIPTSCCRGDVCPGVVYDRRCRQTATYVTFKDVKGPMELLIIMQPDPNKTMKLWWNYIPNPARQVDTCQLANNGVCDYDSGKCLKGTDCSDCGGSNCQATECISAYPYSVTMNIPATCDNPEWQSLPAGRRNVGSKGPWDCHSLEREMRLDCSGCRCEIQGGTYSFAPKFYTHCQPCFCLLQGARFECKC